MEPAFSTEENIAAVASAIAPGQGSIAIIKISGPSAIATVQKIVEVPGKQLWDSHRILYGYAINKSNQTKLDEVLILIMKGPRSFTGEDVAEIHCHGGVIAVNEVLKQVINQPNTRRAFPGEFSQRAILNGRLDLTQAEAINELISAKTTKAAELAMAGINGRITKKINTLRAILLDQLSEIEARIDFEEDLPPLKSKDILTSLTIVRKKLSQLVLDAQQGRLIRNGLKVALIGVPNVGKSSILNLLSKEERAIVTSIPGTTRDILQNEIILEGIPITLLDTAGIRETNNEIERIGISLSQKILATADIIILIFDISQGWTNEDEKLYRTIPQNTQRIIIGNKADLKSKSKGQVNKADIIMSALNGQGEKEMIQAILNIANATEISEIDVALNERQLDLVALAVEALEKIDEIATQNLPWDFWTIDLREAIYKLGELTGEEVTEEIHKRIFSKFCIGK